MNQAYTGFAEVYDIFMDNVPYEKWYKRIQRELDSFGMQAIKLKDHRGLSEYAYNLLQEKNTILDLGCGTGTLTRMLRDDGYDMIGIDLSLEMLDIAREKETGENPVLYLCQDMREFELYGTVGAIISVCDSINYLLKEEDVIQTFQRVDNYLYPGGLFLFDFNTEYKYREIIGDTTIAENRKDCSFIWDNFYHEKEQINEYQLSIFIRDEIEEENEEEQVEAIPYLRFDETHYQRGYTVEEMKQYLLQAGLEIVKFMDADTEETVTEKTQRVFVVARECKKEQPRIQMKE